MTVYYVERLKKWRAEPRFNNQRLPSKSFTSKTLAVKYERDSIRNAEERLLRGDLTQDYTYQQIFEFWLENAQARKRETSLVKDLQMHRDYVSEILSELKVSQISHVHFNKIVSNMEGRGLSPSSINKVIQHFKTVFNYSFNNELIVRNPSKSVKQLKLNKKEMHYLKQKELEQLLSYVNTKYTDDNRWIYVFYLSLFLTGARLGELLALQWSKIDFEKNTILISSFWCSKSNSIIESTKGKKDRLVPLNQLLKNELLNLRTRSTGGFVFSNNQDRPLDASNFRSRYWNPDLSKAKLRRIRIHDARHTYASLYVMNGGSLYDLKAILGHSDIKTTEQYAHLSFEHLLKSRDIIQPNISTHQAHTRF